MTYRAGLGLMILALAAGCSAALADEANTSGGSDLTMEELPVVMNDFAAGSFDQKLDHADPASPTFKQRFWYSTQFAKGPNAPVLYVICGENECGPYAVTGRADVAKTLGAAVVALEHRYYGQSLPFADPKVEDLKYLSIGHALADLDAFETHAKANLGLGGKWIAMGGSYSGMLAAFYRAKYPGQVVGAWASSAPVDMQLFWSGADEVTARALGADCLKLHQQVLSETTAALDDDATRDDVLTRLGMPYLIVPPEVGGDASKLAIKRAALGRIGGTPRGAAQRDAIRPYCAALAQEADPVDGFGLYQAPPLVAEETDPPPTESGPPPAHGEGVGTNAMTMWHYQTCTEVGFYEIPNPNRELSVMSDIFDGQMQLTSCDSQFHVQPNVDATRAEYFDPIKNGTATNLFFVNGTQDPWSALSLRDPATAPAGVTVHIVALATHTQDMSNLQRSSLLGVFEAHRKFHDLAVTWLAE